MHRGSAADRRAWAASSLRRASVSISRFFAGFLGSPKMLLACAQKLVYDDAVRSRLAFNRRSPAYLVLKRGPDGSEAEISADEALSSPGVASFEMSASKYFREIYTYSRTRSLLWWIIKRVWNGVDLREIAIGDAHVAILLRGRWRKGNSACERLRWANSAWKRSFVVAETQRRTGFSIFRVLTTNVGRIGQKEILFVRR